MMVTSWTCDMCHKHASDVLEVFIEGKRLMGVYRLHFCSWPCVIEWVKDRHLSVAEACCA